MSVALLLDAMDAPDVAAVLRERGHDVIAVADQDELRALDDARLDAADSIDPPVEDGLQPAATAPEGT